MDHSGNTKPASVVKCEEATAEIGGGGPSKVDDETEGVARRTEGGDDDKREPLKDLKFKTNQSCCSSSHNHDGHICGAHQGQLKSRGSKEHSNHSHLHHAHAHHHHHHHGHPHQSFATSSATTTNQNVPTPVTGEQTTSGGGGSATTSNKAIHTHPHHHHHHHRHHRHHHHHHAHHAHHPQHQQHHHHHHNHQHGHPQQQSSATPSTNQNLPTPVTGELTTSGATSNKSIHTHPHHHHNHHHHHHNHNHRHHRHHHHHHQHHPHPHPHPQHQHHHHHHQGHPHSHSQHQSSTSSNINQTTDQTAAPATEQTTSGATGKSIHTHPHPHPHHHHHHHRHHRHHHHNQHHQGHSHAAHRSKQHRAKQQRSSSKVNIEEDQNALKAAQIEQTSSTNQQRKDSLIKQMSLDEPKLEPAQQELEHQQESSTMRRTSAATGGSKNHNKDTTEQQLHDAKKNSSSKGLDTSVALRTSNDNDNNINSDGVVKMETSPNNDSRFSRIGEDVVDSTASDSNLITSIEIIPGPRTLTKVNARASLGISSNNNMNQNSDLGDTLQQPDSGQIQKSNESIAIAQANERKKNSLNQLEGSAAPAGEVHAPKASDGLVRQMSSSSSSSPLPPPPHDGPKKDDQSVVNNRCDQGSNGNSNNLQANQQGRSGAQPPSMLHSATSFVPPRAQSSGQVASVALQPDRRCRLCWCCCCPCSALSTRNGGDRVEVAKPVSEQPSNNSPSNKCPSLPNVNLDEIRSWAESFDRLMKCNDGRQVFQDFLRCEYSEENILFWAACEELKAEMDPKNIASKARDIYEDYISILSSKEVSLDSRVRDIINYNIKKPSSNIFDEAQLQIYTLMHRDSYPRFINSSMYKKLAQLPSSSRKSSS